MASELNIRTLVADREKMFEELAPLVAQLGTAWTAFVEKSMELVTEWPTLPLGAMTHVRDLEIALEEEFLRVSDPKFPLPGSRTTDWMMTNQPDKIRPFAAKLAEANAYLIRTMEEIRAKQGVTNG